LFFFRISNTELRCVEIPFVFLGDLLGDFFGDFLGEFLAVESLWVNSSGFGYGRIGTRGTSPLIISTLLYFESY